MNVVLLCRVSTNKQEYTRQVNELTEYCQQQGWHICHIFANKISGAKCNEDRPEIQELIAFVQQHNIDKVLVLEISRLGRNTLEALKVIQLLNEHNICLYVKNYNLSTIVEGKVNPVASLICTILLEIAQMERLTIQERVASGRALYIKKCRENNIKMGRPSTYRKSTEQMKEEYKKEIGMLRKGYSTRVIEGITGTSRATILKVKKMFVTGDIILR